MTETVQRQSVTELLKEKKSLRTVCSFCFFPDCRQAGLTAPGFLWLSYRLTVLFVGEKYKSDSLGHWHNMLAGRLFWSCWTSVADWKLTAWHCWLWLAFVSGANRLSYLGVATSDFSFFWSFHVVTVDKTQVEASQLDHVIHWGCLVNISHTLLTVFKMLTLKLELAVTSSALLSLYIACIMKC